VSSASLVGLVVVVAAAAVVEMTIILQRRVAESGPPARLANRTYSTDPEE
jgi:hypothetical protein